MAKILLVDAGAVHSIRATNVSTETNVMRTRTAVGMANVSTWKALLHSRNVSVFAKWDGLDPNVHKVSRFRSYHWVCERVCVCVGGGHQEMMIIMQWNVVSG